MTPKPSRITAHEHGHPWYYVTWDDVPGADHYECQHEGESTVSLLRRPESAILAIAPGTTRWTQIRNVAAGGPSSWVRVTLNDRGVITSIDDDQTPDRPDEPDTPAEPNPPRDLTISEVTDTSAVLSWSAPAPGGPAVERYQLSFTKAGGHTATDLTTALSYRLSGLDPDSQYTVELTSVATSGRNSQPVTSSWRTKPAGTPPPPPPPPAGVAAPEGLRTHCITTSSAIVEWERAADVDGWEIWIGDRSSAQWTEATRHSLRGLRPNTRYTVSAIARRGETESPIATDTFVTLADEAITGDLPTPTGLHLENPRPGVLQATWTGSVPAFQPGERTHDAFYVSCDGLTTTTQTDRAAAEWTGLPSGEYVVEVYRATGGAVSGIARLAASVKGARW